MFAKVDEELQDQEDIDVRTSGVTLVVAILDETSVTIANCGDCRAVLGCHNGKKKRLRVEVRLLVQCSISLMLLTCRFDFTHTMLMAVVAKGIVH